MSEVNQGSATESTQAPAQTTEQPKAETTQPTGGTLLTSETEPKTSESKPAATPEAAKPSDQPKPSEIKYDLALPKDSLLPANRVDEIVQIAKERGLSNEDAKALLEREDSATRRHHEALVNSHQNLVKQWAEQTQNDKEIGGAHYKESVTLARSVLKDFGSPELVEALDKTGWGNNPELVRLLTRIGKAYAPDTMVQPGQMPAPKKNAADVLYGT